MSAYAFIEIEVECRPQCRGVRAIEAIRFGVEQIRTGLICAPGAPLGRIREFAFEQL